MAFSRLDECLDSYINKTITEARTKAKTGLELTPERAKVLLDWAIKEADYINTEILTNPKDSDYNWGLSEYYDEGEWNDPADIVFQVMDIDYSIPEYYFYDDSDKPRYPELFGEEPDALLASPELTDYFITEVEKHIDRDLLQKFSDEVDDINYAYMNGSIYDDDDDLYDYTSTDYYNELRSFGYDPEADID